MAKNPPLQCKPEHGTHTHKHTHTYTHTNTHLSSGLLRPSGMPLKILIRSVSGAQATRGGSAKAALSTDPYPSVAAAAFLRRAGLHVKHILAGCLMRRCSDGMKVQQRP